MPQDAIEQARDRMKKALEFFEKELQTIRAGRANPHLLDNIRVDYYGTMAPLSQVGNISVPEPRMLIIAPWDASMIKAIEKAIQSSDLGINPQNDGKIIRLAVPELTTERRRELVKTLGKKAEEARVVVRNARRDANELLKKQEKDKEITEDDLKIAEKDIQKATDGYIKDIDRIAKAKEDEIMHV